MNNQEREQYLNLACEALYNFQCIEESLKLCIRYKEIALKGMKLSNTKTNTINMFTLGDIKKHYIPLEPSGELKSLLTDLNLTKWRNYLAHNALYHAKNEGVADAVFGEPNLERIQIVVTATRRLSSLAQAEITLIEDQYKNLPQY